MTNYTRIIQTDNEAKLVAASIDLAERTLECATKVPGATADVEIERAMLRTLARRIEAAQKEQ